jgi:hypothetical protein
MASKKAKSKSGAPRWTYVAGTMVAIVGLVWGIVSFFLAEKPSAAPPATTNVNVDAPGSVGVGTMEGGTITVGAPQKDAAAEPPAASE